MKLDTLGNPIYQDTDISNLIYNRRLDIFKFITVDQSTDIDRFFNLIDTSPRQVSTVDKATFDQQLQDNWFIPQEYKNIDIEGYLVNVCPKENYHRLIDELQEYRNKNLLPLLRTLKYIIDTLRANNIVWGVGRGSSVSSYVLFLLGVHKIDSIKYKLDYKEFLR
jgi:hypothetical protein